jgi:Spy/CpxP family protein refolding chaperone
MEIGSKTALALLALVLSCSPVLAQGDPQDPSPDRQGARDGFGARGQMGPGEKGGRWDHNHDGFGRGDRMGKRGFGRGPGEFGLARLLSDPAIRQQVGITAEQAAKIRQQQSEFRKKEIRERADLEVKRIDLRDLVAADKPDRAAIDSKLQEISASRLALEKSAIDFRLTMRDAISPAQREKLRQWMRDRRRHDGGPARPGPQGQERRGQRAPAPAPNSPAHPQPNN